MQVFFNRCCPKSAILLASVSTHLLIALLANLICFVPQASECLAFPSACGDVDLGTQSCGHLVPGEYHQRNGADLAFQDLYVISVLVR